MSTSEKYAASFAKLIQKETVSSLENTDFTKFYEFHDLLREVFPKVFATCQFKDFDGSFLLKWAAPASNTTTNCDPASNTTTTNCAPGSNTTAANCDPASNTTTPLPVMFMNHHDVVEATGEWKYPPFSGTIAEGKIWGRGTLDTKGGLFCMLQAAEELIESGYTPSRDIYFESTCNEEISGKGAATIAKWMEKEGIKLAATFDEGGNIMYDPLGGANGTFAMVGLGEKGCADIKFVVRSAGGHASIPPKNSPLIRLAGFMMEVEEKDPFDLKLTELTKESFKRMAPYMDSLSEILESADADGTIPGEVLSKLTPTIRAMLGTTLAFTMAKGSDGANVLPQEAYVVGNMRFSHHEGRDGAIAKLQPIADKYGISIEVCDPGFISSISGHNDPAFKLTEKAVAEIFPHVDAVVPYVLTGASDSAYYMNVCKESIRISPFELDKAQSITIHGLNENLNVSALEPAVKFFKYLITNSKDL